MNNPFLALDQQLFGDIYTHTEVMDNLTVLCDEFGSRFGGTEGERLAMEFMQAKLREYGLSHVHTEPVHYLGWRRGPAKLTILEPIEKEITCISLPHSPSATLEGVLVDMGDGAPKDFDKRAEAIKGNIVMTTSANPKGVRRWIHRNERLGRSIMAGATGFIFVSQYPAYGPETGGIGHEDGESLIPGISVGWADGAYLQRLVKRHGQVRIRVETNGTREPMGAWREHALADRPHPPAADVERLGLRSARHAPRELQLECARRRVRAHRKRDAPSVAPRPGHRGPAPGPASRSVAPL